MLYISKKLGYKTHHSIGRMGRMPKPTGQILAKKGFSKLFSCDLVNAWLLAFGDAFVTVDELLGDGATSYLLLRAAGVSEPMFGRSKQEQLRVACWLAYFSDPANPLPTHDGLDDAQLISTTQISKHRGRPTTLVSGTWQLKRGLQHREEVESTVAA